MTKTVPSNFSNEENVGYILLALLSEKARTRIVELLEELNTQLPSVLWSMPPDQMHITLCEIIQPKPYTKDKDMLYELHRDLYENIPSKILSGLLKFTVTLDTIECSPQAIIIKSSDASSFNSIRAQLVKNMPMPEETRTPPDIIHSSIARYLNEVDIEKVKEVIARHQLFIEEEITEFKLLRNEIPPLQKYKIVKTYPLI